MSFLWGGSTNSPQAQFDQLLEQSTSDLLPSATPLDLDSALRLADLVRSASVPPSHASRQLVTRLSHSNPNVQLLALQLADVLVKNAGKQFLASFAALGVTQGGAVTQLEYLVAGPKPGSPSQPVNREVQQLARQKLQDWASAFSASGRVALAQSDLVRLYDRLSRSSSGSVTFPPKDATATAAMVDSLSAPDWSDSPYCTRCRTDFSTFNRKHHCRNCGQTFDQQCSSQSMPLPHYGITEPVRVCDACAKRIKEGKGAEIGREISSKQQQVEASTIKATSSDGSTSASASSRREQEDADLQRAIQASLAESASLASHGPARSTTTTTSSSSAVPPPPASSTSGYTPSYASQIAASSESKSQKKGGPGQEEEEDPDLAAAIAASLRDLQPPATAPAPQQQTYADLFPSARYSQQNQQQQHVAPSFKLPSYDLTPLESSHLSTFLHSQLSLPPSHYPPSATDHAAYGQVTSELQPKLERAVEDARRRGEILREMEAKLAEAARIYGAGLTERVVARDQQPYRPSAPRATSSTYSVPNAQSSSYLSYQQQQPDPNSRYHYAPAPVVGQPLPAYAVPNVAPQQAYYPPQQQQQAEQVASPPPAQSHPQQQAAPPHHQATHPTVPIPAGFYKPSQFPSVPQTNPVPVPVMPEVPRENPWTLREEEEEERREREQVGELIEL
ncbi:hypothetical protein JCM10908_006316 [Rhodotorula pacifica]|uniref:uncharacterized protein n=1 Tax=Rhodotorula pacifica TaxID=1495444 RepID=UPI00316E51AD